ncbi:MAG TPA: acetylornithine deacetylase [Pyrinomonadaceae bacterium]|nr:acetylornithine deacetylase [Pyrinomonadaceae bacterium]
MNAKEILADLVGINSVSARPNRQVIDYAAALVERLRLHPRLHTYKDARGVEKTQLIALSPNATDNGEAIELALVGHTDTVPFDPAWTDALKLTERDARLYGRGACDTKGFIAAALTALSHAPLADLRRPLALILTADEEVGCIGAKHLVETKALGSVRYAVVGEPTRLQPMRAGKGYCLAEVTVRGREGHSAYPALGASAILRAARLVTRVEAVAEELKADEHRMFDPPYTTVNVGLINGGTAKNIIAGECRFTLEWRPVPGQSARRFVELVEREMELLRAEDADFACTLDVLRLDESVETPAESALVRALEAASGLPAGAVAFGTEAPEMRALGAEAVVFGPGDIRVAHRTGEYVPIEELERCAAILGQMIERFCA